MIKYERDAEVEAAMAAAKKGMTSLSGLSKTGGMAAMLQIPFGLFKEWQDRYGVAWVHDKNLLAKFWFEHPECQLGNPDLMPSWARKGIE